MTTRRLPSPVHSEFPKVLKATGGDGARRQAVRRAALETLEERRLLSFSPAVDYPTGVGSHDVATADFNNDGRLDLAVPSVNTDTVAVLLGNGSGNGTFQPAVTSAAGGGPLSVAVGDFNADGNLDLATSNVNDLAVMAGNGDGTFQAPVSLNLGTSPAGVAVGDFNADGKLDLAATSNIYYPGGCYYGCYPGAWSGRINVLLGNGLGAFAPPSAFIVTNGNPVASVALADFNADGKLDAATADTGAGYYGGAGLIVAFGAGDGNFTSTRYVDTSTAGLPQSVAAGDVNGDGKADLVAASSGDRVNVVLGDGAGNFAAGVTYAAGAQPRTVDLADFNGDATIDILATNPGGNTVSVLLGAGGGTFRPGLPFATGSQPAGAAVGDFNADGRADAASANSGSSNASVLLNDGVWPAVNSPVVTIGDVTVTEGNSGAVNAALTVTLSNPSAQQVTVEYATADGTATSADNDYETTTGTLTFTPGQVSRTINVPVNGDHSVESAESFAVVLSELTNAFLGDGFGTVTILDDEPSITIDDVTAAEGNTGPKSFTFNLHLSAATDAPVTVNFSTFDGDTDYWPYEPYSYYPGPAAAEAGSDFVGTTGTATFAAGTTSTTVTVVVSGDRVGEPDEAFSVDLADATGARLNDDHAVGTIVNDEPIVTVVSGGNVTEGDSGTQLMPFVITLSNATDVPVTVNYTTANGTATAGSDYVAKSGSVTFAPTETSKTVNVTVNGDNAPEPDEYLEFVLGTVTNASVGAGQAFGYIVDDDVVGVSINNVSTTEGNSRTKLMTFTVTLSSPSDGPVTVRYATQNGSAKTGKDYTATSGTLSFAPGQTSKTITVSIKSDKQRESDESFFVVLSNVSLNAVIEDGTGEGIILNDDLR